MISRPLPGRREAILLCLSAALAALASAALLTAAALVPAPPVVLPLLVPVCIACPMGAAWELPGAIARLRAERRRDEGPAAGRARLDEHPLDALRRQLDALPETRHPLDL
jgi:hypothetical protein